MQHGKVLVLGIFKTKMFGHEWLKEKRKGEDKGKRGWKEVEENVKWKGDNKAREGKKKTVEYVLVRKIWLTKIQKKGVEMNRKQGTR